MFEEVIMSNQRRSVRIITKYLILIIFTTFLSVNIAFTQEDDSLPWSMTTEDFIDNCDALFKKKRPRPPTKKQEIQGGFCLGFLTGVDMTEHVLHAYVSKSMGNYETHKPMLCKDAGLDEPFFRSRAPEKAFYIISFIKALERLKASKNFNQKRPGSVSALQVLYDLYACDHAERPSKAKGDNQETDSNVAHFKDALHEISPISPAIIFKDALETIVSENYENLSQDEMYKVIYVKGAINSVNESFSREKNSRCAIIPARQFATYLSNMLSHDDEKRNILKQVPLTDHMHMTISLMYDKNCKDDTGGSYDMPKDDNELMAGGFEMGKYYSLQTVELFQQAKKRGYEKIFNEGLIEENKILDGIPIKSLKRIIDERLEELSNQATRGDLTDSKKAFFTGRFGALANKQCNLDPVSSRCFKP